MQPVDSQVDQILSTAPAQFSTILRRNSFHLGLVRGMLLKPCLFPLILQSISPVSLEASVSCISCPSHGRSATWVLLPWTCFTLSPDLVTRVLLTCKTCLEQLNTNSEEGSKDIHHILTIQKVFLNHLWHYNPFKLLSAILTAYRLSKVVFPKKQSLPLEVSSHSYLHMGFLSYTEVLSPLYLYAVCIVEFSVTLVKWACINQNVFLL